MAAPTRWVTDTDDDHSDRYVERFRSLAAEGADLEGEARTVHAMVAPGSRVLDAGCGPGRVGGALHRWGHEVVGVDADAVLIAAAEADHPGPRWLVADLADGDLAAVLGGAPFDAAVLAGNVLAFVAPGTEAAVLANVAGLVVAGGPVVVGFHVAKLAVERFDVAVADAGLAVESMFSTWDLRAWHAGADFVVAVLRSPGPA